MTEEVDSFENMFPEGLGKAREAREQRAKKEKRTQLTDKQRKRGGKRTRDISFRCSPEFIELVHALKTHFDCSIADVLQEAAELYAESKGFRGK